MVEGTLIGVTGSEDMYDTRFAIATLLYNYDTQHRLTYISSYDATFSEQNLIGKSLDPVLLTF
jgi:hypothetical protein